jgi:hypothetical protein
MDHDSDRFGNSTEDILCVSCTSSIDQKYTFCPICGAPVGALASVDPLQTIRTEGFLLQRATEGKPKLIVLIGMWILCFPVFVAGAWLAISVAIQRSGSGASDFVFFWIGVALSFPSGMILFKVTRNYFKPAEPKMTEPTEN